MMHTDKCEYTISPLTLVSPKDMLGAQGSGFSYLNTLLALIDAGLSDLLHREG